MDSARVASFNSVKSESGLGEVALEHVSGCPSRVHSDGRWHTFRRSKSSKQKGDATLRLEYDARRIGLAHA